MKKVLFILIALSLMFGTVALAQEGENKTNKPNSQPVLEKIKSPEEIGNFEKIVKKGKELYGIRKQLLEKITYPGEIVNFDNIKKIGKALWGVRKPSNQTLIRPESVNCVKTALDKRDNTLKTGIDIGTTNLETVIDTRNTCQKAALDKTTAEEQAKANKICAENFRKAIDSGKKVVTDYKNSVWKTFNDDLKACSLLQNTGNTNGSDIKLEDGGQDLQF